MADDTSRHGVTGSGALSVNIGLNVVVGMGQITPYPNKLLAVAEQLIKADEFSISIVVAHIACEVATDRAFAHAYRTRGLEYLEDAVEDLLPGNNLATEKTRKLYTALTGDEVEQQEFWRRFKDSVKRRNQVSHGGAVMNRHEAEESLDVARKLVAHLQARYGGHGSSK